ncbi:reverse transcriptase domain-containing protein [Tanacetum coccineum]
MSGALHKAEQNYAPLEKLALAFGHVSRRLRRYFEAHPIKVIIDQPLRQILDKAEAFGKLAKYSIELGAYNIEYQPLSGAEYEAMLAGLRIARKMKVQSLSVKNILRNQNQKAGVLSKLASLAINHLTKKILVEVSDEPSTDIQEINVVVEEDGDNWMTSIIRCLNEGKWLEDQNEVRTSGMKINQYVLEEGVLFKRSYLMPMLRCVGPLHANYVIREIHMGACGMHIKARSVMAKAIRQGYYWPTMHRDAREEIRKCDSCPLPEAPGRVKFIIIAVDYLTKRIEVKPLAKTTGKEVKKFVWDNIVFVSHPHANGLVERANMSLIEGIKTRVGRERKGWVDKLPNVLWAHQTYLKTSNGETSYNLTFRSEAVILTEIGMPTHRTVVIKGRNENEEEMRMNLDLLQEQREATTIHEARYKRKMEHYYNKRVRPTSFRVGEYVYRKNEASRVENLGKLGPK